MAKLIIVFENCEEIVFSEKEYENFEILKTGEVVNFGGIDFETGVNVRFTILSPEKMISMYQTETEKFLERINGGDITQIYLVEDEHDLKSGKAYAPVWKGSSDFVNEAQSYTKKDGKITIQIAA